MSEKDIKTKPKTTTKAVQNAPKVAGHMAKETVKDIKTVAKDTLVRNAVDKQLETQQSEQPQRAEVEATEKVESAYYSAPDTVYQKGKSFAGNKLKQHRKQVKTRESQNTDIPHTPQNEVVPEVKNPPKQTHNAPKTRKNTSLSSSAIPKTKEQAITDARKKYVSDKLKTRASIEKTAQEGRAEGVLGTDYQPRKTEMFSANENIPKQSETPTPKVKTENSIDTACSSKSMPKTKESYVHSQGKTPADLIKMPDRAKAVQKQNTHTVTRNVSSNAKKAVKTKDSLSNAASRAVKTGNSYVGKAVKQKSVKTAKRAAKTQKEVTKKAAKEAAKQSKEAAQKAARAAKAATKAAVKITVKVAQMVVAATKALISTLVALGGWAVLLVTLIIVIVVAAIAASPFGIFISDEAANSGSIPISSIEAECNMELNEKLDEIEYAATADRCKITGEQTEWNLVLAIFATKMAGAEDDTSEDVVVITEEKKQKLKNVFWDMHEITSRTETVTNGETSEKVIYITINTKTKDDMIAQYGFTRKQQETLDTLLEQYEK